MRVLLFCLLGWPPVPFADELEATIAASGQRIAIANPKTAPYDAAAEAVLKAWGRWGALQGRVIGGENIAQAYQFTASGNAGFGFVGLSQMLNPDQLPCAGMTNVTSR